MEAMKPSERLKEIESVRDQWFEHIDNAWIEQLPCGEVDWLINRVRRLTEALEFIQRCAQQYPKCNTSVEVTARKALESEE
jgi:hypothetical protein